MLSIGNHTFSVTEGAFAKARNAKVVPWAQRNALIEEITALCGLTWLSTRRLKEKEDEFWCRLFVAVWRLLFPKQFDFCGVETTKQWGIVGLCRLPNLQESSGPDPGFSSELQRSAQTNASVRVHNCEGTLKLILGHHLNHSNCLRTKHLATAKQVSCHSLKSELPWWQPTSFYLRWWLLKPSPVSGTTAKVVWRLGCRGWVLSDWLSASLWSYDDSCVVKQCSRTMMCTIFQRENGRNPWRYCSSPSKVKRSENDLMFQVLFSEANWYWIVLFKCLSKDM